LLDSLLQENMPSVSMNTIAIIMSLLICLVMTEPLENCKEKFLSADESADPGLPECLPYDGSLLPNCMYFLNNYTSYYHLHEYNCSRFWECSPEGPCLNECAPCATCSPYDGLVFDCRYEFPEGPVCDWPDNVNCTNHYPCTEDGDCTGTWCSTCVAEVCVDPECCADMDCPPGQICLDGACKPDDCTGECCSNSDCSGTACSTCENNACVDPECCSDDDCPDGQCINGSCVACQDECCSNTDCTATDCSTCVANACVDPECCSDDDCPDGKCIDGKCETCQEECCSDNDCTGTGCSTCEANACVDPECCSDDDCPNGQCINGSCVTCTDQCCSDADCPAGQTCVDGVCKAPCNGNGDCTGTACSTCEDTWCNDPECCTDEDCPNGQCINGSCVPCQDECCSNTDCTATECSTCVGNACVDPECCSDEDCPEGQCVDGKCVCSVDTDCQNPPNMPCSVCTGDNTCSQPQCCVDADCPAGFICEGNACVPAGECDANTPCDGQNSPCDITTTPHGVCEWCDLVNQECKPGCDSGDNCPHERPICSKPDHQCNFPPGPNGVESITIATDTCSSCAGSGNPTGKVEGGVGLQLIGLYNTNCNSNGLDNLELVDYDNGRKAVFDGTPDNDGSDDGLAGCKLADLNEEVSGGTATWTGDGVWTGAATDPICVKFSSEGGDNVTCCCKLESGTLETGDQTNLTDCQCTKN